MKTLFITDHLIEPSLPSHILDILLGVFEKADIATLAFEPKSVPSRIKYHKVHSLLPAGKAQSVSDLVGFLPILPGLWSKLPVADYELVIILNQGLCLGLPSFDQPVFQYQLGIVDHYLASLGFLKKFVFQSYLRAVEKKYLDQVSNLLSIDPRFSPGPSHLLAPFIQSTELEKDSDSLGEKIFIHEQDPWLDQLQDSDVRVIRKFEQLSTADFKQCRVFVSSHFSCFFDENLLMAMNYMRPVIVSDEHSLFQWMESRPGVIGVSGEKLRESLESLNQNMEKIDRKVIRREVLKLNGRIWRRRFLKYLARFDVYPG